MANILYGYRKLINIIKLRARIVSIIQITIKKVI